MFQHQRAIVTGCIKNKGSYIQHVLQVPVTLHVIKYLKILQLQLSTSTVHTAVISTYINGTLVLFKSQLFIFSIWCVQTSLNTWSNVICPAQAVRPVTVYSVLLLYLVLLNIWWILIYFCKLFLFLYKIYFFLLICIPVYCNYSCTFIFFVIINYFLFAF